MGRTKQLDKKVAISLSIREGERAALEFLAGEHGCTWGDQPNISALVSAIAAGEIRLSNRRRLATPKRCRA
jgi:hypothetical protein